MTSSGLHSTLAATAALLIAIIFLRAAWHKLRDVESFAALAADYRLLPAWAANVLGMAIAASHQGSVANRVVRGTERPF